jgi:adenylosuccinate synthase
LRVGDSLAPDFCDRVNDHIAEANRSLRMLDAAELDPADACEEFRKVAARLKPYIADTSRELHAALQAGKTVLAEGAQGTLLDIDMGTYPFVTSSNTTAPGALTGLGLGLDVARDARVVGVVKAFQTRVGSGPFPTEVFDDLAQRLRGTGEHPWDEYGTTTGRPRRVGWLDGVLLRFAVRINGIRELAATKLDILSGLKEIRLCIAYRSGRKRFNDLSFGPADMRAFEPVYEDLPGWEENISDVREWKDLPAAAQAYLERVASLTGVPVRLVSVGAEREQIVLHK